MLSDGFIEDEVGSASIISTCEIVHDILSVKSKSVYIKKNIMFFNFLSFSLHTPVY